MIGLQKWKKCHFAIFYLNTQIVLSNLTHGQANKVSENQCTVLKCTVLLRKATTPCQTEKADLMPNRFEPNTFWKF